MSVPARLQPFLFAGSAVLVLACFVGYDLYRERERSIQESKASTANLTLLLAAHARQSLRRIEALLSDAANSLDADPARPIGASSAQLQLELNHHVAGDGLVSAVAWLDSDDRLRLSTSEGPTQELLTDWVQRLHRTPPGALTFGRLWREPSGRWRLPVGRRIATVDGRAAGSVVALLDPMALQPVLDAVDKGANGFVTLFLSDGWMVATSPRNEALFQTNWFETPMFKLHLPRARVGTVQQIVVRDGTERVYSYRALDEFPVVVSMGISMTDALAEWRVRAAWDGALLALVAAALSFGAAGMSRTYARREAAERASAEAARKTQAIVDHAADGIVTFDEGGVIESVNAAGAAMFGRAMADLAGRPVSVLLPAFAEPGSASRLGDERSGRAEQVAQHVDGNTFPVEIAVRRVSQGGHALRIALIRDITHQRTAQAKVAEARDEAQRSERFLQAITDNLPLRIAYVDRSLRYTFVNRAQRERFGLPREAIVGRTWQELTGSTIPPELAERIAAVLAGQDQRFEFKDVHNGQEWTFETHLIPDAGPDGHMRGFYVASADVTERHRQQDRIERALAERETLLREVYHRVKNNLQVVQSLLNLQRRTLPEGAARAALDDSVQRVYAMALVHEKLYQTGNLDAVPLDVYTRDLLDHVGESAGAAQRGIALGVEVDPIVASLEVAVPLGLLIAELVGNSLKHAYPAGRSGAVRVRLRREDGRVTLEVADDGTGLPPGFELGRSDSMGLQLAASLAAQLGGELRACNASGALFAATLSRLS